MTEKKINGLQDQLMGLEASLAEALSTIEAIEANIDMMGKKNLDEAIMWYNKFLGFEVFAGEGVRFVFNKVGMQRRRACSLLVLHCLIFILFENV
uniref:Uncharacterized protein n=1 Tax=Triticum urartu TaxID=4572 RepID=A0A8R7P9J1_TRIUA